MKNYCVYKHTTPNNKVYIGITSQNPLERWKNGNGYKNNNYFWNAIVKYGWDNIKHEILFEGLTKEEACQKEVELIAKYKSNNYKFGYNKDNGGFDIDKHSNATKEKISNSLKGHVVLPNSKEKMKKKRILYKQHYVSVIDLAEEYKIPYATLYARLYYYNMPIEKALNKKVKRADCMPVLQYNAEGKLVKRYDSIYEAYLCTGISHIVDSCKGKRKTAGGYFWKYE